MQDFGSLLLSSVQEQKMPERSRKAAGCPTEAALSFGSTVHFCGYGTFFNHCLRDVCVSSRDYFCFPAVGYSDYSWSSRN